MSPAVTICIPAYNAARYLPATLASVRAQTFTDWELIVTEDGSTETVAAMVEAFSDTVPQRVLYQWHDRNRGLPATRNTGIAAARHDWIALLDSDDLWTADHLANLVARAEADARVDFVHAGSMLFASDTGAELELRAPTPEVVRDYPRSLYLGDYVVQPSSVLLKKSLWSRVGGFNPAFRYVEDREMWLRCARAGAVFAYTGRPTCRYRKHAAALTTHAAPMARASAEVLSQHLDWPVATDAVRRQLTAEAWVSAGRLTLRAAPRDAHACFCRAWQIQPSPRVALYRAMSALLSLPRPEPASLMPNAPAPSPPPSAFSTLKTSVHGWLPGFLQPRVVLRHQLERATRDGVVLAGPFRGMKYVTSSIGSMWWPKILGTYERELAVIVDELCLDAPARIIDIGAAEGYYAVGFAWRCPQSRVIAFEGEASGRALQHELATLNGVAARLTLHGYCDHAALRPELIGAQTGLIICDIEGGELALLNPAQLPELATGHWTLLVEIHHHVHPEIARTLIERFRTTHVAEEISSVPRVARDLPPAAQRVGFARWTAPYLDERRPGPMSWLLLRPRP